MVDATATFTDVEIADPSLAELINETSLDRFWDKVEKGDEKGDCWMWQGAPNHSGYGKFRVGGQGSPTIGAHCFAWRLLIGPIPPRRELHHTCEIEMCVNPRHLVVTRVGEHRRRFHHQNKCGNGHDLTDPKNVYSYKGQRLCRPCRRLNDRRRLGITQDRWLIQDEY